MSIKDVVRWGVPVVGFLGYVKWGGVSLAVVFALVLFAITRWLISWHQKSPKEFFRGMKVISVLFVLVPAILLTLGAALTSPILLVPALVVLALAVFLVKWSHQRSGVSPLVGAPSMATRNLEAANDLTRSATIDRRRQETRGKMLDAQAEASDLAVKNRDLADQNTALQRKVDALEREAALPPDPFADPLPHSRSQT